MYTYFLPIVVWMSSCFQNGLTQTYTDERGTIQSPNYPDAYEPNYGPNIWSIIPTSKGKVILYFRIFDVQNTSNCLGDRVNVTDIADGTSKTYCGKKNDFTYTAAGPVNISFVTDNVGPSNNTGFQLEYIVCGGMFDATEGSLRTPDIDFQYDQFKCLFHITIPVNKSAIQLHFDETNFESSSENGVGKCLINFDASEEPFNCTHPSVYISRTNALTLSLIMVHDVTPVLNATFTKYDCDKVINATVGIIHSPNYPIYYSSDSICDYTMQFTVPPGKTIGITFSEKNVPCGDSSGDSIKIINPALTDDSEICNGNFKNTFYMREGSILRFTSAFDKTKARFNASLSLTDLITANDPTTTPSTGNSSEEGNPDLPIQTPPNTASPPDKTLSITVTRTAAAVVGAVTAFGIILALCTIVYVKRFKSTPAGGHRSQRAEQNTLNTSSKNMNVQNIYTEAEEDVMKVGQTNFGGEYMDVSDDILNKQDMTNAGNIEDLYQETTEGEYDLLHKNRKKENILEEKLYDVSSPDDGMYSETNVQLTSQNNDVENMYDHAKALPPDENAYDTAPQKNET